MLRDPLTLDSKRFPNFARLANGSTWFRNTTSVSGYTNHAVPSILTGRFPRESDLPTVYDHPQNLFTLLAKSYELKVYEDGERLLPNEYYKIRKAGSGPVNRLTSILIDLSLLYFHIILPAPLGDRWLPPVTEAWGNFGNYATLDRPAKFYTFLQSIQPATTPGLYYLHSMLPHHPWEYLPSGEQTNCRAFEDPEFRSDYRCLLLQVGFVDRLVGSLINRLKSAGLYDRCLLIVTADHGIGLRKNQSSRTVRGSNYPDFMLVPFFMKTPYQKDGRISDLNVQSVDILPTICEQLGARVPWTEGVSIFDPSTAKRTKKTFFLSTLDKNIFFAPVIRVDQESIRKKEQLLKEPMLTGFTR